MIWQGIAEDDGKWDKRPQEIYVLRDDVRGFVGDAAEMTEMKSMATGFAFVLDLSAQEGREKSGVLVTGVCSVVRAMSMSTIG